MMKRHDQVFCSSEFQRNWTGKNPAPTLANFRHWTITFKHASEAKQLASINVTSEHLQKCQKVNLSKKNSVLHKNLWVEMLPPPPIPKKRPFTVWGHGWLWVHPNHSRNFVGSSVVSFWASEADVASDARWGHVNRQQVVFYRKMSRFKVFSRFFQWIYTQGSW